MRKNRVLTVVMAALVCAVALAACGKDSGGSRAAAAKAAANPATDFHYDLSEDGKGVVIKKFLRYYETAERDESVIIPRGN
jgi:uncharacterized lipoprotein YehR (DUF1307 family)